MEQAPREHEDADTAEPVEEIDYFDPVQIMDDLTEYVQRNNDEILRIALYGLSGDWPSEDDATTSADLKHDPDLSHSDPDDQPDETRQQP